MTTDSAVLLKSLAAALQTTYDSLVHPSAITLSIENCSIGSDLVIGLFHALVIDGSGRPFALSLRNCGIDTKCAERLGTLLHYADPEIRQRLSSLRLQEASIGLDISSVAQLLDMLVPSTAVDLFLIGDGKSGKTQLEARLRDVRGDVREAVRTIGANSLNSGVVRRVLQSGPSTSLLGRFSRWIRDQPRESPPLGKTGFTLGDVVEIGGQLEYRYLYRFLGSLFRIHVMVVRMPAGPEITTNSFENLKKQLRSHLGILSCRFSGTSANDCPTILVAVNCSAAQVC